MAKKSTKKAASTKLAKKSGTPEPARSGGASKKEESAPKPKRSSAMGYGYKVYFTERSKHRVMSWDPDSGKASVVAGDRKGTKQDHLNDPYGLAMFAGRLVIADKLNDRLCSISGENLEPLSLLRQSNGGLEGVKLLNPAGLFARQGENSFLAAFSADNVVARVHKDGRIEPMAGIMPGVRYDIGACEPFVPAERVPQTPVYVPVAVASRSNGAVYFIERGYQTVREIRPDKGMRVLFTGDYDPGIDRKKIPATSSFDTLRPPYPTALAVDQDDRLYLADGALGCIWEVDTEGNRLIRVAQSAAEHSGPLAMNFGPDGVLWCLDGGEGAVKGHRKQGDRWEEVKERYTTTVEGLPCVTLGGAGLVCFK